MSNEIFLVKKLTQTLGGLSQQQKDKVVRTIDELGADPLGNSFVVVGDDSPGGGLRAAYAGSLRILLRYAPDDHRIIIADIEDLSTETAAETLAASY